VLDTLPLPSFSALFVLLILVALALLAIFVAAPVMRVTLTPASENLQREVQIVVDPEQRTDNVARATLPGEPLQSRFEVTGSVPTSGEKEVGRDPARGEVVFSNASANAVVLPARGVVVARNGVRFLLDGEVRIGAYSYGLARAGVTAEQRGAIGNVEANQMANLDPPIDRVTVTNPRPMAGGSDRPARVAAVADQTRLREQLIQRARDQAQAEFGARGGEAQSVPAATVQVKVDSESYQPGIEAEGEQLSGTMAVNASAVAWNNQALNALVQKMLLASYGSDYALPLNQLRLTPPEVLEYQEGKIRLRLTADAVVTRTIDPAPIAEALRWKSDREARALLGEAPGLAGAQVELSPPWAPRALRVEVNVAAPK
jgi:hypothetical protein